MKCTCIDTAPLGPGVNMVLRPRLLSDTTAGNLLMNNQKEITLIYLYLIITSFAMRKAIFWVQMIFTAAWCMKNPNCVKWGPKQASRAQPLVLLHIPFSGCQYKLLDSPGRQGLWSEETGQTFLRKYLSAQSHFSSHWRLRDETVILFQGTLFAVCSFLIIRSQFSHLYICI